MLLNRLVENQLVFPPKFLADNTFYITQMGSHAYACHTPESDYDYYGFCVASQEMTFPHLAGEIPGFGRSAKRFEQWQEQSKEHKDFPKSDWTIYSIVKYFDLCMGCNPNVLNSIFTPRHCVIHSTQISELVRENRRIFLSKKAWHTHKGYAYAQQSKMKSKNFENEQRKKDVEIYGFSTKFAYHLVRLLLEVEQILLTGDVDLQLNGELYKSIRRGEWSEERLTNFFIEKEKHLENLYHTSDVIPFSPDEAKIKDLLLKCLEMHYGNIDKCVKVLGRESLAIQKIKEIVGEF